MAYLFGEYDLLAKSDLFDAEYYLRANPDIAALNVDPLIHYLEWGCRERRDPSDRFDTSHYLRQCKPLGDEPGNALFHYLTVGVNRGLTPKPDTPSNGQAGGSTHAAAARTRDSHPQSAPHAGVLYVDIPRIVNGAVEAPVRGGLSIVGWGLVSKGVANVEIALDGQRVTAARCGLRRPDVAAAHPTWEGALLSGYAAHLPPKALALGRHTVKVSLCVGKRCESSIEFQIDVQQAPDDHGPWSLRRKMSQVEVDFHLATLTRLDCRPTFQVLLPVSRARKTIDAARRTSELLSRQTYPNWQLHVDPAPAAIPRNESSPAGNRSFVIRLAPGDELGCDALLEFALASAFDRSAELLYCDERRMSPEQGKQGKVDAFFKPGWSPDLLLSTNYIGRAWCADVALLQRAGLGLATLGKLSDYEIALRLTETAHSIRHVPKLLYQREDSVRDSDTQERDALVGALQRRGIVADVRSGRLKGSFRVKRKLQGGRVSIIICTCAAGGLIKTCIESLRQRTAYRDYEIICIENIPASARQWKGWLQSHADIVIECKEEFNWSRYNNIAAARATGPYLLFLNDDIEVIDGEWLDALLEQAQRPEVGVVGPQLLYPDRSVQHAGVMLDWIGRGRHAFRHLPEQDPGYFGLALTQRNVIGVTGACLMTRRETFEALGRFDQAHAVINNDLDYCLKSWCKGLLNVYTPHARLIHHELASRSALGDKYDAAAFEQRWRRVVASGDPYFNVNLSREHEQFTIEPEPLETIYAGYPLFARESVHRIVIVKLDHIGDCITALPALRRLKQHFPAAHISVVAGRATLPIWKAEKVVDETIELNFFHARSSLGKLDVTARDRKALADRLYLCRFDLAIDLRKQPDTREILKLTGARILAGFDHQGRFPWLDVALEWDEDVPLRTKRAHVTDDLNALVDAIAASSEPRAPAITSSKAPTGMEDSRMRRLLSRPLVCVHPAAGTEMRQWPLDKFAELIELLLGEGNLNVAIIGGADEEQIADQVLRRVERRKQVFNLVGKLSLADLPKLLARAALFVGNNSGPQHLAASLGVPTVGIHSGVVDAHEWGPAGPRAVAIRRQMSCSPCFIENAKDCPRALACLTGLASQEVFLICKHMLPGVHRGSAGDDADEGLTTQMRRRTRGAPLDIEGEMR